MTLFYIWCQILLNIGIFEFDIKEFISSNSLTTLFIKINSSWLILKSIKASEIKTCKHFYLDFANYNILSWFFFFLLITDLYFLIPAIITQIIAEIVIPLGTPTKEAKEKMEKVSSNFIN